MVHAHPLLGPFMGEGPAAAENIDFSKFRNNDLPKNFILFVGSRLKYKNFELLLKSYCMNNKLKDDIKIVCFGGGDFSKKELKIGKITTIPIKPCSITF